MDTVRAKTGLKRILNKTSARISVIALSLIVTCYTSVEALSREVILGEKKIVGGVPTTIEDNPWQAALIISRGGQKFLCGGSVVSARYIVTAAHCFLGSDAAVPPEVILGETDFQAAYQANRAIQSLEVVVHDGYDTNTNLHDIALVLVNDTSPARVIPLAVPATKLVVGEALHVTGWGAKTEFGPASNTLMVATVPYVNNETCNEPASYNGKVAKSMMCAGKPKGGEDSCQGDSGGPLVKGDKPEEAILVGIVSFGEGCGKALKYGVYTRISADQDWIRNVISK
ncbi:serine protease [Mesorhizobium sp.]|uniref:serine protease n=1 Tax=Mesorhizobium sp. TaxID=1871066 RepID=UPI000FE928F9|nr:serine protease [Mesorhizobium sp.]RWO21740.1 MAG: serine protease [Mesorhizobium sp.]